jgi:hypothetical protein
VLEVPGLTADLQRDLFYQRLRARPGIWWYLCVSARLSLDRPDDRINLAEKTSVIGNSGEVVIPGHCKDRRESARNVYGKFLSRDALSVQWRRMMSADVERMWAR